MLAADRTHNHPTKAARALWRVSQALFVAATASDAYSSWGRPELNPILGQRFGMRGAGIKIGLTGGLLAVQELCVRRGVSPHVLTGLNLVGAGVYAGTSARNMNLGPRYAAK